MHGSAEGVYLRPMAGMDCCSGNQPDFSCRILIIGTLVDGGAALTGPPPRFHSQSEATTTIHKPAVASGKTSKGLAKPQRTAFQADEQQRSRVLQARHGREEIFSHQVVASTSGWTLDMELGSRNCRPRSPLGVVYVGRSRITIAEP